MKTSKRKKLEAAGWKIGSAADFLELSEPESMLVELKLDLGKKIKELRKLNELTQVKLAQQLNTSQSRIAKIEAAASSVSMDLQVSALAALGASRKEIGEVISLKYIVPKRGKKKTAKAKKEYA